MKFLLLFSVIAVTIFYPVLGMAGGWSEVSNINSSNFQRVVSFAAMKMSEAINSPYLLKPVEVFDAKQQVVAGMNYEFTLRLAATECKKNTSKNVDVSDCQLLRCGPVERCTVRVWDIAWENKTQVTKRSCEREPKKVEC